MRRIKKPSKLWEAYNKPEFCVICGRPLFKSQHGMCSDCKKEDEELKDMTSV